MKISIIVTLKENVLDPQGRVILQTIQNMGIENVKDIRQGKFFKLEVDEKNSDIAKKKAHEICEKLLANSVIEDFKVINI